MAVATAFSAGTGANTSFVGILAIATGIEVVAAALVGGAEVVTLTTAGAAVVGTEVEDHFLFAAQVSPPLF